MKNQNNKKLEKNLNDRFIKNINKFHKKSKKSPYYLIDFKYLRKIGDYDNDNRIFSKNRSDFYKELNLEIPLKYCQNGYFKIIIPKRFCGDASKALKVQMPIMVKNEQGEILPCSVRHDFKGLFTSCLNFEDGKNLSTTSLPSIIESNSGLDDGLYLNCTNKCLRNVSKEEALFTFNNAFNTEEEIDEFVTGLNKASKEAIGIKISQLSFDNYSQEAYIAPDLFSEEGKSISNQFATSYLETEHRLHKLTNIKFPKSTLRRKLASAKHQQKSPKLQKFNPYKFLLEKRDFKAKISNAKHQKAKSESKIIVFLNHLKDELKKLEAKQSNTFSNTEIKQKQKVATSI